MSRAPIGQAVEWIMSGGQTGVDRAALDVALAAGIPCGGWCPRGRRAEDGRIPDRYPLDETPHTAYAQRTEWNVRDSDGTLILARGKLRGGTSLTAGLARSAGKPVLVVDLDFEPDFGSVRDWIRVNEIEVLNIAGPRESQSPGIADRTSAFLAELFRK
ncbi:MAG: putative molybdenum carrier protein [Planctomycetales bacterium]